MTIEEREAFKKLLSIAARKEISLAKHPDDKERNDLWDGLLNSQIDLLETILGDDSK